jgi:hypothetical protein
MANFKPLKCLQDVDKRRRPLPALLPKGHNSLRQNRLPSRTCFVAGTLVTIVKKEYRSKILSSVESIQPNPLLEEKVPIETVKVGDVVKSANEHMGKISYKRVINTYMRTAPRIYEIKYDNGQSLETTGDHPFYIQNQGWKKVSDIRLGENQVTYLGLEKNKKIYSTNDFTHQVKEISFKENKTTVYNFEVDDDHTYFVTISELWVHNADKYDKYDKYDFNKDTGRVSISTDKKTKVNILKTDGYTTFTRADIMTIESLESFEVNENGETKKFTRNKKSSVATGINMGETFSRTFVEGNSIVTQTRTYVEEGVIYEEALKLSVNGEITSTQKAFTASGMEIDLSRERLQQIGSTRTSSTVSRAKDFSGRTFFVKNTKDDGTVINQPNTDAIPDSIDTNYHYTNPNRYYPSAGNSINKSEYDALTSEQKASYQLGTDQNDGTRVDLGLKGTKAYGPSTEFTIESVTANAGGGSAIIYSFTDKKNKSIKTTILHLTEVNNQIVAGAVLPAGTWIGTANDYNGFMTGMHLHLDLDNLKMKREEWRQRYRGTK